MLSEGLKRIVAVAVVVSAVMMTSCQESLPARCSREAREYTEKNCPARVGEQMLLDSVTFAEADSVLGYYYSVSGELDSAALMAENEKRFRDAVEKELRNSTNIKAYKEAGFTFEYIYISSKKKNTLLTLRFEEKDYR